MSLTQMEMVKMLRKNPIPDNRKMKMLKSVTKNDKKDDKKSNKKKDKTLLCSGDRYNPRTHKCVCLSSGKCVIVKRIIKNGNEKLSIPKREQKRRNRIKKKQQKVMKYLSKNPKVMSAYWGGVPLNRNLSKNVDDKNRTKIEIQFHQKLLDDYQIDYSDLDTYEKYLDSLGKTRIEDASRNRERLVRRLQNNLNGIDRETLTNELRDERAIQDSLGVSRPLTDEDFDYTRIQSATEADTEESNYSEDTIEIAEETAEESKQRVINENRNFPPPSQKNIRLAQRADERMRMTNEDKTTKTALGELTQSNIERLQRQLGLRPKVNKYIVDDSGVSITSKDLEKLGVIPSSKSSSSKSSKSSIKNLSKKEIEDIIEKIESNKRYSGDEVNKRREPFLKMLDDIDNSSKNSVPTYSELDYVSEDSEDEEKDEERPMDSSSSDSDLDEAQKLSKKLRGGYARNKDGDIYDDEFVDSYSLKNTLMNGGEIESDSMKYSSEEDRESSMESNNEEFYSGDSENDFMSESSYESALELEYPPINNTFIAPSA